MMSRKQHQQADEQSILERHQLEEKKERVISDHYSRSVRF
jgi:hypothetical protein